MVSIFKPGHFLTQQQNANDGVCMYGCAQENAFLKNALLLVHSDTAMEVNAYCTRNLFKGLCIGLYRDHINFGHRNTRRNVQTTTVYKKKEGGSYEAKDYTFKLQSVKTTKGIDKLTTIGKCKIDFADFCSLGGVGGEQEIHVALPGPESKGCRLRAFVGATFLKIVDPADDTQSEVSCMTTPTSLGDDEFDAYRGEQV